MNIENPEKGKMRIVHMKDGANKKDVESELNLQEIDIDFINKIEFKNSEEKVEAQRLINSIKESKDLKERDGFVFALRNLLNSLE